MEKRDLGVRVRRARKERGYTLKDLEARAGVSATHLSEIERGLTSPSIQVLAKIAHALGRQTKFFLESTWLDSVSSMPVERRPAPLVLGDGVQAQELTSGVAGHRLAICLVRFEPGTANEIEEPAHEGDEALFVLSGSVRVAVDGRDIQLDTGDALHFRCDQAHRIRNSSAVAVAEVALAADRRLIPALRKRLQRAAVA